MAIEHLTIRNQTLSERAEFLLSNADSIMEAADALRAIGHTIAEDAEGHCSRINGMGYAVHLLGDSVGQAIEGIHELLYKLKDSSHE